MKSTLKNNVPFLALAGLCLWLGISCKDSTAPKTVDRGMTDTCPASCDDRQDCTTDSCDPVSHLCLHTPLVDGTSCEDGQACTIGDWCQSGLCFSGRFKSCVALDQCHLAGKCDTKTGECTNPIAATAAVDCNDEDVCTLGDQCLAGVCQGIPKCTGSTVCIDGVCKRPGPGPGEFLDAFPTPESGFGYDNLVWQDTASSPDGAVLAVGIFNGPIDLGVGAHSPGVRDNFQILMARLDPATGKSIWSQDFGDPEDKQERNVISLGVNGSGQFAFIGNLRTFKLQGSQLAAVALGDAYILGGDTATGSHRWFRGNTDEFTPALPGIYNNDRISLGRTGKLKAIAGDPSGDAFVLCGEVAQKTFAGNFLPATNPYPLLHHGGVDILLASVNGKTGETNWVQQLGGTNDDFCSKVAIDPEGNIYVSGTYTFSSIIALDGLPPLPVVDKVKTTGAIPTGMFLFKFSKHGKPLWSKGFWAPLKGLAASLFIPTQLLATADNVLLAGAFANQSSLDSRNFKDPLSGNFLAKFSNANGELSWLSEWKVAGAFSPSGISVTSTGDFLVVGAYSGELSLGNFPLQSSSNYSGYIAKLSGVGKADGTGIFTFARGFGKSGTESNRLTGILVNRSSSGQDQDSSLLFGAFKNIIDLGAPVPPLISKSTNEASFIAKLVP